MTCQPSPDARPSLARQGEEDAMIDWSAPMMFTLPNDTGWADSDRVAAAPTVNVIELRLPQLPAASRPLTYS